MPTPSEILPAAARRSVFGNYPADGAGQGPAPASAPREAAGPAGDLPTTLQSSIDTALARSYLHRHLARLFEVPDRAGWAWLCRAASKEAFRSALAVVARTDAGPGQSALLMAGDALLRVLEPGRFQDFDGAYLSAFGHTVRGDCPMNEIEYGDIKADPLFQPHRLADLGAFYGAFGMELAPDAAERIDHVSIELEFMSVLAAKEAYGLEHQFEQESLAVVRGAQKEFLREHLARWTPAFSRRLARSSPDATLAAVARFLGEFVRSECLRFAVNPGSEDLLLRPVDESGERLCDSCGLNSRLPGAATPAGE